jgi:hypothetical protein
MPLFLMLIKVTSAVRSHPSLVGWMNEIETSYMDQYGSLGASAAHLVLDGQPWDFALLFPGSLESVNYLTARIMSFASDTIILTMQATDLDAFRAAHA